MNIAWITLEPILPSNTGGRIGVFKRIEYLSKTNNIFLFFPYDDETDLLFLEEMRKYCKEVHFFKRKKNFRVFLSSIFFYPFTVASRKIKSLKKDLEKCLFNNKIDLINIDFPHMCVNLPLMSKKIPIVLNQHNIEWLYYKELSKSNRNFIRKFLYWFDSFRLKRYEERLHHTFNFSLITFVSIKDKLFYEKWIGKEENMALIPVGSDLVNFIRKPSTNPTLLFVGKMSAYQNIEAVLWFCKKVLPVVKERIPNVTFVIVGKEPAQSILDLKSESVVVTGTVDDVERFYSASNVVVLPLLHGGGVKIKLLEGIAHCLPVVTTSIGAEGTEFVNGQHILISDDCLLFAENIIKVLIDEKLSRELTNNAYSLLKEKYLWKTICDTYCLNLKKVAGVD